MSTPYVKFHSFLEAWRLGLHDFSADVLQLALLGTLNPPDPTDTVLGDLTEISYANLSPQVLVTLSEGFNAGIYSVEVQDLVLSATGAVETFRYVVVFNQDAINDELICFYDYGSPITFGAGEDLSIYFGASLFTIS